MANYYFRRGAEAARWTLRLPVPRSPQRSRWLALPRVNREGKHPCREILLPLAVAAAISLIPGVALASGLKVSVWADAKANGGPGFNDDLGLAIGPAEQNLFLSQGSSVYSTTGPSGSAPGSFSFVKSLPDGENEGSAFVTVGGTSILYVPSVDDEEVFAMPVTGSGASVALGTITVVDGEDGPESGDTGQLMEFDEPEGLAVVESPLTFDDPNSTPLFATSFSGPNLVVNGTTFPIIDANWSGKTILILNQEEDNLIAFRIDNDGTLVTPGIALATNDQINGEAIATTQDGRFAYVPTGTIFYRVDLHNIDSTGGSAHVEAFNFTGSAPSYSGVAVGADGFLYTTGKPPSGTGVTRLYRLSISSDTGDPGPPESVGQINAGSGNAATGFSAQMIPDGSCFLVPDSTSGLIFQVCPLTRSAPALGPAAMLFLATILLATGTYWIGMTTRPS